MVRERQVVLITGASRGLGAATARELAERGHTVIAGMRRPEQDAAEVREGYEGQIEAVRCDITEAASVEATVRSALEAHGRIDALINNAGYGLYGPVEEVSDEEIRAQFETNVTGTLRMTRAVLPAMRQRRAGRIIMVGSISSFALAPLSGMYAASKAALEVASETLRYEVAHWGIEVGVVQPGVYKSGFHDSLVRAEGLAGGASAYQPIIDRVVKEHFGVAASRPGPRTVALTMADAVEIEQPLPMRWPIGEDSQELLSLRRLLTDSQWEGYLRSGAAGIRSAYFEAAREVGGE